MGVFLQKMVLHRPDVIEAQLVSEPALFQRVVVDRPLNRTAERTGCGQFEEDTEFDSDAPVNSQPAILAAVGRLCLLTGNDRPISHRAADKGSAP